MTDVGDGAVVSTYLVAKGILDDLSQYLFVFCFEADIPAKGLSSELTDQSFVHQKAMLRETNPALI